jgi:hypothetical protein
MLLMIGALALVLIAIQTASNPNFWAIWFPEETSATEPAEAEAVRPKIGTGSLSGPRKSVLEGDEVLIVASGTSQNEPDSPQALEEPPLETETDSPSTLPELKAETGPREVSVDLERLHSIEDNAVGIRPNEAEAFYYLLDHAAHVPLDELVRAGTSNVAREALLNSPGFFRGKPILLEGEIRRLQIMEATPNIYDIDRYFEAWIFPRATGNIPWHVVSLEADSRLPIEESITNSVRVRVSGYFFKLEGYAANSGLQVTPVLVARKIEFVPPPPENPIVSEESNLWIWLFAGFCVVFAVAIWSVVLSTRGSRKTRTYRKQAIEAEGDLSEIAGQESFQPESHLQQMLDRDERAE